MKRASQILLGFCLASVTLATPKPLQHPAYIGYQDSIGQYSFGYSAPESARSEVRESDGQTRGSYSYVDGDGVIQSAKYTADEEHGFRIAATNLPQAVEETPEVMAAREAHLEALKLAYERERQEQQILGQQQFSEQQFGQQVGQQVLGQQDLSQQEIDQQILGQKQSQFGQQQLGQPQSGHQRLSQPQFGQQLSQPQFGQQQLSQPQFGQQLSQPQFGQQQLSQPQFGQQLSQPQFGQQQLSQPQFGHQQLSQPQFGHQQLSQPQFGQQLLDQPLFGQEDLSQTTNGQQQFGHQDLEQQQKGQQIWGQQTLVQQNLEQQQTGQQIWGQQNLEQQTWNQLDGNVVVGAKIRKEEPEKLKVKMVGAPNKIVGQIHRNVVSQESEILQSPEVDAARRAYIQAISAARAKAETEKVRNAVNDVITKVSQRLGPVVEATVTDESGAIVQQVGQTKGALNQGQASSGPLIKHESHLQRSGITPASTTLIMKNQTFAPERFMEQANLKDKQSTPDAGTQLYRLVAPSHFSKPLVVPSTYVPIKYSSDAGTPPQPTFAVQCFITRADQLGNLVDVN